MIARPIAPVIRLAPFCFMFRAPLPEWVTENSATVVASVEPRCRTIESSISQYGMKP